MAKTIEDLDVDIETPDAEVNKQLYLNFLLLRNLLSGGYGVSGTFTTVDGKTITVVNGIITEIV